MADRATINRDLAKLIGHGPSCLGMCSFSLADCKRHLEKGTCDPEWTNYGTWAGIQPVLDWLRNRRRSHARLLRVVAAGIHDDRHTDLDDWAAWAAGVIHKEFCGKESK